MSEMTRNAHASRLSLNPSVMAVLVAIFAFFSNSLPVATNSFFVADDHPLIRADVVTEEPIGTVFTHANYYKYYRPMQIIFFRSLYSLFGLRAGLWHLAVLLIHAANALLVFVLISEFSHDTRVAALAAAMFSVFRMSHVAVSWTASSADVLLCFFGLVAILCVIRFKTSRRVAYLIASCVALGLAFLSKEPAIVLFPTVIVFLMLFTELKRPDMLRSLTAGLVFVVITGCYLYVRFRWVSDTRGIPSINGVRVLYAGMRIVPNLFSFGFFSYVPGFAHKSLIVSCLLLLAAIVLSGNKRTLFLTLWTILALLPVCLINQIPSPFTDPPKGVGRHLYHGAAPFFALLAVRYSNIPRISKRYWCRAVDFFAAILVVVLLALSIYTNWVLDLSYFQRGKNFRNFVDGFTNFRELLTLDGEIHLEEFPIRPPDKIYHFRDCFIAFVNPGGWNRMGIFRDRRMLIEEYLSNFHPYSFYWAQEGKIGRLGSLFLEPGEEKNFSFRTSLPGFYRLQVQSIMVKDKQDFADVPVSIRILGKGVTSSTRRFSPLGSTLFTFAEEVYTPAGFDQVELKLMASADVSVRLDEIDLVYLGPQKRNLFGASINVDGCLDPFESIASSPFAGFHDWKGSIGAVAELDSGSKNALVGNGSLRITTNSGWRGIHCDVSLEPSFYYFLRFFYRGHQIRYMITDIKRNILIVKDLRPTGPRNWGYYSGYFKGPRTAGSYRFSILLPYNGGTAWLDGAELFVLADKYVCEEETIQDFQPLHD